MGVMEGSTFTKLRMSFFFRAIIQIFSTVLPVLFLFCMLQGEWNLQPIGRPDPSFCFPAGPSFCGITPTILPGRA